MLMITSLIMYFIYIYIYIYIFKLNVYFENMILNYPKLNKRSIFTTESVLPDECKHSDGIRC